MIKFKTLPSIMAALIVMISLFSPMTAEAADEGQIRDKIVSVASAEVGYTGTSTYSKYGDWYGYQGGWCTTFVLWCYNQTDSSLGTNLYGNVIPSGGNCNSMISWYENKDRYHKRGDGYSPKAGDLVFFDWSGNGSSQHVGIVDYISGSTVYTIEGNCSGQVKAREYTANGTKPYNNISAIMGYGSPDFSKVSGGISKTTAKKTTSAKTTSKKAETKKRITTTAKKTTSTTTEKTTEIKKIEKLSLANENYELKIGDTVQLDYSIEPQNIRAVVEYFCDEEGIIDVAANGDITAIGTGNATVVVCANNDIYSQCSITVEAAVGEVTTLISETANDIKASGEDNSTIIDTGSIFTKSGININLLIHNRQLCIILISIVIAAFASAITIRAIKRDNLMRRKGNGKRS